MYRQKYQFLIAALLMLTGAASAPAADVDVQLSTREAYVGQPVTLQVTISNASDYEQPAIPDIDGADVRSAGAPSQSSQITIINGRRSESRSISLQYLITPRREGTFEVPALSLKVDGRNVNTRPLRFVATKSETGDLLFVEIEGGKDKVYVGEPLDLKLRIWIKPYRDRAQDIELSEASMWQMISDQTAWGSFAERMQELADNNQRPGGQEVLRDNGQGSERSYYLYEINATVYPKRPGRIDADDVQIVVNYPTALGKSRDPFDRFFEDSPFGRDPFAGNSPLSRMMDDDFFQSPFSNRLAVTSARPIAAGAEVDATQVVPVPTEGRPAHYRGAVGRYRIVTQATPTAVAAGDPVTLNIGIAGNGPMELVQAPPLAEMSLLTDDFKVADESLAGFVQDDSKVFSTTIRPRRDGITQIPPIPFSFFDPETEEFQTVTSEPISITVEKSESLALDAIVGNTRRPAGEAEDTEVARPEPSLVNDDSADILVSESPATASAWWWPFVVVPPCVWIATVMYRSRAAIGNLLPSFKSAKTRCLSAIARAVTRTELVAALVDFIARRTGTTCETPSHAVGALRTAGFYGVAGDVESFVARCERTRCDGTSDDSLAVAQSQCREQVEAIDTAMALATTSRVKRSASRSFAGKVNGNAVVRRSGRTASRLSAFLLAVVVGTLLSDGVRAEVTNATITTASGNVELTHDQRAVILAEASDAYSQAMAVAEADAAQANELFSRAADRYQLLVNSGIRNSRLFRNLGNAYLQTGEYGRAIANYERARDLNPTDRQLKVNLEHAESLVAGTEDTAAIEAADGSWSLTSVVSRVRAANEFVVRTVGITPVIWTLVTSSVVFWGLLISQACGVRIPAKRLALVPLLMLVTSFSCVLAEQTSAQSRDNAVLSADSVTLRSGDGDQFDEVVQIARADGRRVKVLGQRNQWVRLRVPGGEVGWVRSDDVEIL